MTRRTLELRKNIVKLPLTNRELTHLKQMANEQGLAVAVYIRQRLLDGQEG